MPNASKTVVRISLSVGIHTLFSGGNLMMTVYHRGEMLMRDSFMANAGTMPLLEKINLKASLCVLCCLFRVSLLVPNKKF